MVVEHEYQWYARRDVTQETGHRVEESELAFGGVCVGRLGQVGEEVAQGLEDSLQLDGVGAPLAAARLIVIQRSITAGDLAPRPERRYAGLMSAPLQR
jgi:hypothetical protein